MINLCEWINGAFSGRDDLDGVLPLSSAKIACTNYWRIIGLKHCRPKNFRL